MQPKARMTFRFDGTGPAARTELKPEPEQLRTEGAFEGNLGESEREQPFEAERSDKPAAVPSSRAAKEKANYQAWHSPYQDDIRALEEIIRRSDSQAPVAGFSRKDGAADAGAGESAGGRGARPPAGSLRGQPQPRRPVPVQAAPPVPRQEPALRPQADGPAPLRERPSAQAPAPVRQAPKEPSRTIPFPGKYRGEEPMAERPIADEIGDEDSFGDGSEFAELEHGWIAQERYPRQEGPSWLRVCVTVIGAIATGGLFGYLLLTLFTGSAIFPNANSYDGAAVPAGALPYESAPADPGAAAQGNAQGGAQGAAGTAGGGASASAGTAAADKDKAAALTLYWLQYGVFQTESSMNEAAEELRGKGLAAATDTADGYRVYAGVAPTKETATALAGALGGSQVYAKAVDGGALQLAESAHAAEYAAFLNAGSELAAKIAGFTTAALSGDEPAAGDDIQSIRTAHQVWLDSAKAAESWEGAAKQAAQAEIEQYGAAVTALNEYGDKPSAAVLWNAQTSAMNAVLADLRLRAALQAK